MTVDIHDVVTNRRLQPLLIHDEGWILVDTGIRTPPAGDAQPCSNPASSWDRCA